MEVRRKEVSNVRRQLERRVWMSTNDLPAVIAPDMICMVYYTMFHHALDA